MPIFQDDLDHLDQDIPGTEPPPRRTAHTNPPLPLSLPLPVPLTRKISEESIRTELCEGPIPDSPPPVTPERDSTPVTSDRAELIERLKRGESPTWIPNRHLESLYSNHAPVSSPRSPRHRPSSPSLLPPPTITPEKADRAIDDEERLRDGLSIERPRSALHSGDFTHDESPTGREASQDVASSRGGADQFPSSRHSWIATSPPRDFSHFQFGRRTPFPSGNEDYRSIPSSLSSSFSSSFVYKPPTSPLVQSEINEDVDLSLPLNNINITSSPMNPRRHTMNSATSSPFAFPSPRSASIQRPPTHRREGSLPYQAHQPRRSLTSTPNMQLPGSSPQTPAFLRSRRPSFSSDTSPIQHASMVGSYEESILRGRMSTTPSKPLDFLAQIGVLGLGKCKASLRCPAHVTLPFPAVFYSYGNTSQGRMRTEDGPSPYVGQIDLENGLHNSEEEQRTRRKLHSRYPERRIAEDDTAMTDGTAEVSDFEVRKAHRTTRRSGSPRAPPGGSYRIPEKGQIQIVIKNPNKTAVKLFLVPYDLAGMEPGMKTFIRQRSYSAGPIIDNVQMLDESAPSDKPILRYLVHLHICCPSRGRYYLYKSIRIVFANRVPDGKEKLRNETTWPEPRFAPYKPIRVMHPPLASSSGPGAILAAEKAFRRRSSGFSFGPSAHAFDAADGTSHTLQGVLAQQSSPSPFSFGDNNLPVDPVPFRFTTRNRLGSDLSDSTGTTATGLRSPDSSQASRPTTKDGWDAQIAKYEKLSKGDVGYGGNAFAPSAGRGSPGTESLLSQRLRSLGVQSQGSSPPDGVQD